MRRRRIHFTYIYWLADQDDTGEAAHECNKMLTFYELDLGLNHVVRAYIHIHIHTYTYTYSYSAFCVCIHTHTHTHTCITTWFAR